MRNTLWKGRKSSSTANTLYERRLFKYAAIGGKGNPVDQRDCKFEEKLLARRDARKKGNVIDAGKRGSTFRQLLK